MAEIWGAAIAAAGAIGGAAMSARSARDSARSMGQAQAAARTQLGNARMFGPGGMAVDIYDQGQTNSITLGQQQQGQYDSLGRLASTAAFNSNYHGLPSNVADALRMAMGGPLPSGSDNAAVMGNVSDMLRSTFANVGQQGNYDAVRDDTLAALRTQAEPFERRAFNSLQNNQFATGRLGTSGGALQTEAFARGLAQADTERQLIARQEARNVQNNEDSLLQSAFGRFVQTAGMANDLAQQRFGNSMLLNDTAFNRGQQNLQNQIMAAQLPTQLQGQQLQLALQAMQGQGFLTDQGMQQFQAALAAAQAGANARIGSGSNVAALATARAGMPTSGDIWGQALTGIASRVGGSQSTMQALSGLFGTKPPPSNTPGDVGFVGPTRVGP